MCKTAQICGEQAGTLQTTKEEDDTKYNANDFFAVISPLPRK